MRETKSDRGALQSGGGREHQVAPPRCDQHGFGRILVLSAMLSSASMPSSATAAEATPPIPAQSPRALQNHVAPGISAAEQSAMRSAVTNLFRATTNELTRQAAVISSGKVQPQTRPFWNPDELYQRAGVTATLSEDVHRRALLSELWRQHATELLGTNAPLPLASFDATREVLAKNRAWYLINKRAR